MAAQSDQKDTPSLDEWMSKIREKKLRPVVPNQHKIGEIKENKGDKVAGAHNANEIVKMRQGLRSVSTPKWPGPNDSKTKASSTIIPQRAQLRSISGRTPSAEAVPGVSSTIADNKGSTSPDNQESFQTNSDKGSARQQASMVDSSAGVASSLDDEADSEFPLDTLDTKAEPPADSETSNVNKTDEPVLSASSGVTEARDVELVLPNNGQDTFPLDLETSTAEPSATETLAAPSTPIAASTGVFDTSDKTVELRLPAQKDEAFPLDLENSQAESVQPAAEKEELAPASGVTDPQVVTPTLDEPPKAKSKSKKSRKSKKGKSPQVTDTNSTPINSDNAAEKTEEVKDSNDVSTSATSAKTTNEDGTSKIAESGDVNEVAQIENEDSIKCSQCSVHIPLADLSDHKC